MKAGTRFFANINHDSNGCWLWTGALTGKGYGRISINSRWVPAHRFGYEKLVGPIPEGLVLDHLCRVRHCVNPAHLEPVTTAENVLRGTGHTAVNARKTHCANGHPYTPDNTIIRPSGRRACRICNREVVRRHRERKPQIQLTRAQRRNAVAALPRVCAICGSTDDLTVDHIVPTSLGGTHDHDNLQTLCRPCNARKGARLLGRPEAP